MNTSTVRHLWAVIEETQGSLLLRLNDADLVQQLLLRLERQFWLSFEETDAARIYIQARIPLIRDMAQSRLA